MTNRKGNRARVRNRWYGANKWGEREKKPRASFKGTAQFTLDDVFIMPFTHELTSDELGRKGYTPLSVNRRPTGIHVFDDYLQALSIGDSNIGSFCDRYQAKTADLDGLVFLLTGISNTAFRNQWILRTADLLLRYTDLSITEIADRSGAGTRNNLYFMYERDFNCSPTQRRDDLRMPGDLGHYRI